MDLFNVILLFFMITVVAVAVAMSVTRIYYHRKFEPIIRDLQSQIAKYGEESSAVDLKDEDAKRDENLSRQERKLSRQENIARMNALTNLELFDELTAAIRTEKWYLTPKFGRKQLVEHFRLSNHRVGAAFSEGGTSLPVFIRECRLDYAQRLMIDRPDLTLNEVAAASGFSYTTTFNADFKNKFGVSPTQYREQKGTNKAVARP
jgi:AraC-like DNA-binding protein